MRKLPKLTVNKHGTGVIKWREFHDVPHELQWQLMIEWRNALDEVIGNHYASPDRSGSESSSVELKIEPPSNQAGEAAVNAITDPTHHEPSVN